MAKSQPTDEAPSPAPNLLAHLAQTFGWTEKHACDALGAYLMSTEAGRNLRHELKSCNPASRAA